MKAQGAKEGKDNGGGGKQKEDKKKDEPPAPTPAKREDVVFDVTDKTLQKVGAGFCLRCSCGRGDELYCPPPVHEGVKRFHGQSYGTQKMEGGCLSGFCVVSLVNSLLSCK